MTNNNWEEEFDEKFRIMHLVEVDEIDGTFAIESDRDKVKNFILNLLTKKDQEHKEQIELIMKYVQSVLEVQQFDSHINKLSTE